MTISLIAAIDKNSAIGYKNQLLIKLKNDMKHFKDTTTSGKHNIVLYGRKTLESMGNKPLKDRINIVMSKDYKYKPPTGVYCYHTVQDVLNDYYNHGDGEVDLFICGGESIYKQFLRYADRIILTIIDHEFPNADTYFPKFNLDNWKVVSNIRNAKDEHNPYDHYFVTYERK